MRRGYYAAHFVGGLVVWALYAAAMFAMAPAPEARAQASAQPSSARVSVQCMSDGTMRLVTEPRP